VWRVYQRRSGRLTVAETVTVSAQNRNFPGRSGPGKLYLASPYVVAASAIAGKIVDPKNLSTDYADFCVICRMVFLKLFVLPHH
jgi:aconitase A